MSSLRELDDAKRALRDQVSKLQVLNEYRYRSPVFQQNYEIEFNKCKKLEREYHDLQWRYPETLPDKHDFISTCYPLLK
jgi:hypothetical protein